MKQVSNEEKIKFLRWFLQKHQLKSIEANWLLNYFAYTPGAMDNIHFVSDATLYDSSIFLSSRTMKESAFIFTKGDLIIHSPDSTYSFIKNNPDTSIYVQCNFPLAYQSKEYCSVLGEKTDATNLSLTEKSDIKDFLAIMVYSTAEHVLTKDINKSLDTKNQELFTSSMEKLRTLHSSTIFQMVKKSANN